MSKFISKRFDRLEEYVPGEQPQDKKYIKLNTNESPYPPSPMVTKAINEDEVNDLRLYSDPEAKELKKRIAEYYNTCAENVFVSNGSDETLNFFFMAFCDEEKKVAFPDISYGFYEVFAQLYNLDYKKIPLLQDFSIDVHDYENIGRNVVIANPNAPTGLALGLDDIEKIVVSNREYIVVIDEAYVDFGAQSAVGLTEKYNNLLVVQTFSKSRSLAGARLGFAIGSSELIKDLEKIKFSTNPYNVNRLTMIAGEQAVADREYFEKTRASIISNRRLLSDGLKNLGFAVTDSKANFVFAESDKISGEEYYQNLKERGILVRHFSDKKICNYNRITVGTAEEVNELLAATEKILDEKGRNV